MKIILCFLFVFILTMAIFAQDKADYDFNIPVLPKTATLSGIIEPDYRIINNNFFELTLTREGYFTIGTTEGRSTSTLDDNCNITFGHPFAKTSYPVFSLDGPWHTVESYFNQPELNSLTSADDTLVINGSKPGILSMEFSLLVKDQNPVVEFIVAFANRDTIDHDIGFGIIVDPALGKWGDGVINFRNEFVKQNAILTELLPGDSLCIWEKGQGAKGIGLVMDYMGSYPDKIFAVNWRDYYNSIAPEFDLENRQNLYDLLLKIFWRKQTLEPGEVYQQKFVLKLLTPDFSNKAFLRWDLPPFLEIENGIMFPQRVKSLVELYNTTPTILNSTELKLTLPEEMNCDYSVFNMSTAPNSYSYENITINTELVYEDKVVELRLDVVEGEILIENLTRNVFIPSTPVSDTGLVIINDSISIDNFPEIELIFSTEIAASGQRILDLKENNIFLFENNKRITNLALDKYSGGGSTLADVVFVLDVSGSMGNERDQVVAYLGEFADSLARRGYDYRIGLVTFSTDIDEVIDLTSDIDHIKQVLAGISLWGGLEDSPLALYTASELTFRSGSVRTIIWITDEPYPEHSYTKEQVVNRMLTLGITVHGVGLTSNQTDWFNPITIPTGGNFYDIAGNFRDILLDVTRIEAQDRYNLQYQSLSDVGEDLNIILELHYGGLGVIKNYFIPSQQAGILGKLNLHCFPNPFNPVINLVVNKDPRYRGTLNIYNILGQRVRHFKLNKQSHEAIIWDGRNENGVLLGSGFYIVQLIIKDQMKVQHRKSAKILYLK